MERKSVTRRGFIAGAMATGALGILTATGCSPQESKGASGSAKKTDDWTVKLNTNLSEVLPGNTSEKITIEETKECDVVVIGGGCSGTNTAVRAAEKGLRVILLEKSQAIGGASLKSSGPTAPNSKYEVAAGITTDTDKIIDAWVADSHWRVDAAAIRQLVTKAGEAVDWMTDNGWEFTYTKMFTKLPDYEKREPLFREMLKKYVEPTGEVITEATAKYLITDDKGTITGVVASKDNKGLQVNAKAIVIATGGYGGNQAMVKTAFNFDGVFAGIPQNIGEGLEMAWKVGAQKPQNFGGQMLHQTLARATDSIINDFDAFPAKYPMILTYIPQLMNVGSSGARFRNEALVLSPVPSANSSVYQGSFHYVVVSKGIMDILEKQGLAGLDVDKSPGLPPAYKPKFELTDPWTNISQVFDKMVEKGGGFKADTSEELANQAGMDVDVFTKQMKSYEEFCINGSDTQFGKPSQYLKALGSGPYYLITAEENNLGSWGGLLTNTDFEVLDEKRVPIKGLYAVGNEAGSNLYNDTYVGSGYAMANTITSGYLCGAKLAAKLG